MKYLKSFESYLEGGHQPLYHITQEHFLNDILKSDELKTSNVADTEKCICVTRSLTYDLDSDNIDVRFVLDYDLMLIDGYKSYPYDEQFVFGKTAQGSNWRDNKKLRNYSKVNYKWRPPKHNLKLRKTPNDDFTWEYEERIYSNIKPLGVYLIAIDINENIIDEYKIILKKYIKKYPHIKIVTIKDGEYWNRKNEMKL